MPTLKANSSSKKTYKLSVAETVQLQNNYERLKNLPSVNGVTISGDLTSADLKFILKGTTEYWNSQRTMIALDDIIYVYTDYQTKVDEDGKTINIPGIKIGDGTSYLIDMPFVNSSNEEFIDHMNNSDIHVTEEEKIFWNNKWRGSINTSDFTNLIFSTN